MKAHFTRAMLWTGIMIVVALLGLNAYMALKPAPKAAITAPLKTLLPPAPEGWTAQDVDIADSPEQRANVENILHFDDATYRVYNDGRIDIGVYVAYWKPGQFSPAKVGSHTPDTCWVHNGWDRVASAKGVTQDVGGGVLKPMTTGEFSKDHDRIYVIFWHLVGGQAVSDELVDWENGLAGRIERLPAMMSDFSKYGLDQRREQLVVRVSSTVPFTELWNNPGFASLMKGLGRSFDLFAKAPPGSATSEGVKQASLPGDPNQMRTQ